MTRAKGYDYGSRRRERRMAVRESIEEMVERMAHVCRQVGSSFEDLGGAMGNATRQFSLTAGQVAAAIELFGKRYPELAEKKLPLEKLVAPPEPVRYIRFPKQLKALARTCTKCGWMDRELWVTRMLKCRSAGVNITERELKSHPQMTCKFWLPIRQKSCLDCQLFGYDHRTSKTEAMCLLHFHKMLLANVSETDACKQFTPMLPHVCVTCRFTTKVDDGAENGVWYPHWRCKNRDRGVVRGGKQYFILEDFEGMSCHDWMVDVQALAEVHRGYGDEGGIRWDGMSQDWLYGMFGVDYAREGGDRTAVMEYSLDPATGERVAVRVVDQDDDDQLPF
jgi:hypothetical protein